VTARSFGVAANILFVVFSAGAGGSLANAAELDIPGDYGDEAGCRFAKTNNYSEEEILLLTRQYVTTQVTQCSFVQIFPAEADSQVAIVSCGHEGEETTTLGLMRVQKSPDGVDGYLIFDQDGTMWGKAGRCR
jgi:hypothetical protein